MEDIMRTDLYELLQIDITASSKEIKTAYRKKALTCHPDKNPDNPKAAELFQELAKALEILTDGAARAAYDKLLKARKATQVRNRQLDSKRKKLKDDLEARERLAREEVISQKDVERELQEEITRLRKEGSKQLEEERILLKKQLEEEFKKLGKEKEIIRPRLKLVWTKYGDNGGYTHDMINKMASIYGEINCLVMGKKGGSALVEFFSPVCARQFFEIEKGLKDNPLVISWIQGEPEMVKLFPKSEQTKEPEIQSQNVMKTENSCLSENDYESLVLTRLRQAQERKKLIDEIKKEES